jgi:hypothetical protein
VPRGLPGRAQRLEAGSNEKSWAVRTNGIDSSGSPGKAGTGPGTVHADLVFVLHRR